MACARLLASAAAGLWLAACATAPVAVNPTYAPPPARDPVKAAAGPRCQVGVTELVDARRAPETLGVVAGRAVKAPDDRDAWLRSVVDGLGPRGFDVTYDKAADVPVRAQIRLQTAWVTEIRANKSANIVLHVSATRAGGAGFERDYRGSLANINWVSGEGELRGLVDRAIAKALDEVAVDLGKLCAAPA